MGIQLLVLQFQIILAVLLVLLLRLAIRKLPKVYSYILWLLVFARLLCPVALETSFSIMPSQEESEAWVEQALQDRGGMTAPDMGGEIQNPVPPQFDALDAMADGAGHKGAGHEDPVGQYPVAVGDKAADSGKDGDGMASWFMSPEFRRILTALPAVWVFGVILILGYNGFALLRIRRLLKSARQYQDNVYVCEGVSAPFTLGLFHPSIYIPDSLADGERDYIICHERVHIRRKDYLVKNLAFLLTALYWFNPFVWLAFYFLERDMEMSCDERVIKLMGTDIKRSYSQSLLNFAEGRGSLAVTPLTFGENSVKQRVKNVLSYKNARRWSIVIGVVILAAAGVLLFTTRSAAENGAPESGQPDMTGQQDATESGGDETDDINNANNTEPIESRAAFEQRYGTAGSYEFGNATTGYSVSSYTGILQHLIAGDDEYYKYYTDPVSAAVQLLHLGAGAGKAEYSNVPMTVEGFEISWLQELNLSGEGSSATVSYTFASDGSMVEIPMELIESSMGLWAPASGMARVVYQTRQINPRVESGEECYIQTSLYGIYRLDRNGLRCIYPHYVPSDLVWTVSDDGRMYFPASASYQDGDLDYWEDVLCILDTETGEYDMETYPITDEMSEVFPIRWISVYGGFVQLYGQGETSYYMPVINTGSTPLSSGNTWKGNALAELDEQEMNAYGAAVRDYLLNHPGQLVELSNRTMSENYVYVDWDGDGRTERVTLAANPEADFRGEWPYDNYELRVGDSAVWDWYECLHNAIWAVSLDGQEIILALYGMGPSNDPMTFLYRYEQGELKSAGFICDDIRQCTIENGAISGTDRHDVLQTDWVKVQWRMGTNEKGEKVIEIVPQDTYDFVALNDITLLKQLPVHSAPDTAAESHVMQPQTLRFLKTDSSFTWIYAEAADGDSGWFQVEEFQIQELGLDYYEVFDNLSFAD